MKSINCEQNGNFNVRACNQRKSERAMNYVSMTVVWWRFNCYV